jgi:hypothetical protein
MRPHLRHTSRLTVGSDGTQPGQLVLTFESYQEPTLNSAPAQRLARPRPCRADHGCPRRGLFPVIAGRPDPGHPRTVGKGPGRF